MDLSGSSNIEPRQQAMEVEMAIEEKSLKRRHPDEDTEMVFESSDGSDRFAQQGWQNQPELNLGVFRGNHEHMAFGKRRKLNCGHPHIFQDETSDIRTVSIPSDDEDIYVEPIYVAPTSENYPNINPTNPFEPGPMTYNNEENFIYGNWILITNVHGGWSYKFVKIFLRGQLGLVCMKGRPLPGTQPAKDDFRIIVPFETKKERDKILEYLLTLHVTHYFNYSIVDVLPVGSYDSDTDNDDVFRPIAQHSNRA